jgi:hypothetical protein
LDRDGRSKHIIDEPRSDGLHSSELLFGDEDFMDTLFVQLYFIHFLFIVFKQWGVVLERLPWEIFGENLLAVWQVAILSAI